MEYKIDFKNFWSDHNKNCNWFTALLDRYNISYVVTEEDPNIIIYGPFGNGHNSIGDFQAPEDAPRIIYYTAENRRPDPRADLNLTFDHGIEYNNIRLPYFLTYYAVGYSFYSKDFQLKKENKEKFCCFVYSNCNWGDNVDNRNKLCLDLSQYKKVDAGGECLNNVEKNIPLGAGYKIEFQKEYKFCIAYENSLYPGYTTEKILHAYESNCIPIYYGSERIAEDFNKETFINAHDFNSSEELIEYIKRVDTDEELYNSYLNKPIFSDYWLDVFNDPEEKFFKDICNKILGIKI
jgi:hypothetical protein